MKYLAYFILLKSRDTNESTIRIQKYDCSSAGCNLWILLPSVECLLKLANIENYRLSEAIVCCLRPCSSRPITVPEFWSHFHNADTVSFEIFTQIATSMIVWPAPKRPIILHFMDSSKWYCEAISNHFRPYTLKLNFELQKFTAEIYFVHRTSFIVTWHNALICISKTV